MPEGGVSLVFAMLPNRTKRTFILTSCHYSAVNKLQHFGITKVLWQRYISVICLV